MEEGIEKKLNTTDDIEKKVKIKVAIEDVLLLIVLRNGLDPVLVG